MNGSKPGSFFIARYVDDIFIGPTDKGSVFEVRKNVFQTSPDLTFTFEEPKGREIQYLDLILSTELLLCWRVGKCFPKSLLPAGSSHLKTVKDATVSILITSITKKLVSIK